MALAKSHCYGLVSCMKIYGFKLKKIASETI